MKTNGQLALAAVKIGQGLLNKSYSECNKQMNETQQISEPRNKKHNILKQKHEEFLQSAFKIGMNS